MGSDEDNDSFISLEGVVRKASTDNTPDWDVKIEEDPETVEEKRKKAAEIRALDAKVMQQNQNARKFDNKKAREAEKDAKAKYQQKSESFKKFIQTKLQDTKNE